MPVAESLNLSTAGGATLTGGTIGDGGLNVTTKSTTIINTLTSIGDINLIGGGATTVGTISTSNGNINIQNTTGALGDKRQCQVFPADNGFDNF